jgi:ATP-binding cassette subfamily F protein 3
MMNMSIGANKTLPPETVAEKPQKKVSAPAAKTVQPQPDNSKKIKALQQELKKVEEVILKLETEKQQVEAELAKPEVYGNPVQLEAQQTRFIQIDNELKTANSRWEELVIEMEG